MTTVEIDLPEAAIERIARRAAEIVLEGRQDDGWLDAKGAAAYLALPVSTIHRLSSQHAIPCEQDVPGGKLYFKRSTLDAWRAGGTLPSN